MGPTAYRRTCCSRYAHLNPNPSPNPYPPRPLALARTARGIWIPNPKLNPNPNLSPNPNFNPHPIPHPCQDCLGHLELPQHVISSVPAPSHRPCTEKPHAGGGRGRGEG
jgi:hypothetical protein